MNPPSYTTEALIGSAAPKPRLHELLFGHSREEAYYEARDDRAALYLLWMECRRFGSIRAYPCVLREGDSEPLVFNSSVSASVEDTNYRILRQWEALDLPARLGSLQIQSLNKEDFRQIYRSFRSGIY